METHALDDDQPVARLLIGQLAARAGLPATPRSAAEVRVLWQRFGVLCDSASAAVRSRSDRLPALEVERAKFPDDDALAAALAESARAVPEELVLSNLVEDLRSRSAGGGRVNMPVVT